MIKDGRRWEVLGIYTIMWAATRVGVICCNVDRDFQVSGLFLTRYS